MLTATPIVREFHYNGTVLPDPNPALSIAAALDILAQTHPELTNAKTRVEFNPASGKSQVICTTAVGTKG